MDDPLDLVVAVAWWLVVAAVAARHGPRVDDGSAGADALGHGVPRRGGPRWTARIVRPAFRWVKCGPQGSTATAKVWEGEVVAAHDPDAEPAPVRVPRARRPPLLAA
ncbi:MAG: hypothetical protein ACLTSX_13780 [Collinsella sp.]